MKVTLTGEGELDNMSRPEDKPIVFISYSHKDEKWKDLLLPHLKMLQKAGRLIVIWDDRKIDGGDTWYPEIVEAMDRAAAAVCLISANYLASDFINKEEIPFLLRRCRNEGMLLLPVLTHQCLWKAIEWLEPIQMLPRDGQSIAEDFQGREHAAFTQVARCVLDFLQDVYQPPEPPPPRWPELPQSCLSIERLPQTGAEVFGRKDELAVLDDAWESDTTRIVSFVAWGGVGKSALVNKWAEQMKQENYRGAERVYAWSFYSQGTGERVTSADLFIDNALRWFGDAQMADSNRSPWDKGQRLAELVQRQRTLLLLDGLEPLQSWWEHDRGRINDPALAVLVKQLARKNPGLCVITSREKVAGLEAYSKWFIQKDLEQISAEAGRALLRVAGIRGTDAELEQVVRDFGNHALAINLLASYLRDVPGRHVSHASTVSDLDIPPEKGKHPRRVMEAFARRFGDSPELNILHLMGLFDRPATGKEIDFLRNQPAIPGLTDHIARLPDEDWNKTVQTLRHAGLIAPQSHHDPRSLDAHPLAREHFGERIRDTSRSSWTWAHSRLYKVLCEPLDSLPDTLAAMAPLLLAVAHGCNAGWHPAALRHVYRPRIRRGNEAYIVRTLGASSADLAAITAFFKVPWTEPVDQLAEKDKIFVLGVAGGQLHALGRLREAMQPMNARIEASLATAHLGHAAVGAGNLSRLLLDLGDIDRAGERARENIKFARDNHSPSLTSAGLANLGAALHHAGRLVEAMAAFAEAEATLRQRYPHLASLQEVEGFHYCDLFHSLGEHREAQRRAMDDLEWVSARDWTLAMALDRMTLARASLLLALQERSGDLTQATALFNRAVDGLRGAGHRAHVARGLLARAELHRVSRDSAKAQRDLDEAYEIAIRGPMRLYECDVHLESCRLILAMEEAAEKLDPEDLFPDSPLALYDAVNNPLAAARKHLDKAETMVKETGYHRRDPELLLEAAHLETLEGKKDAARRTLAEAKKKIDEMGAHRSDIDLRDLQKRL